MKFVTFEDLRNHQNFEYVETNCLAEGFRQARPCQMNMIWSNMANLEKDATQFALEHGWDPESILVLYDPPKTEEEREAIAKETARQIAEDPDWDDIQIGYVPDDQVIASLYKDMTIDDLINAIMAPARSKASS